VSWVVSYGRSNEMLQGKAEDELFIGGEIELVQFFQKPNLRESSSFLVV
jgi:hypothetical protein